MVFVLFTLMSGGFSACYEWVEDVFKAMIVKAMTDVLEVASSTP